MANPAATALMGLDGEVALDGTDIARLTQWSLTATANISEWGDSDSQGYTHRKAARHDGSGSVEGKLDSAAEAYDVMVSTPSVLVEPEQKLYIDKSDALYWQFPCVVYSNFQLTVNTDSKEVLGWSADYGASGPFYRPGTSAP